MGDHRSGKMLRSDEKLDLDTAIWYIDATINFTYAKANHAYSRLHRDTIFAQITLGNDLKAMLSDVFNTYDESLSGVGEKYHAVNGENKQFIMATITDAGPLAGNKRKLRIITLTGTGISTYGGDFGNDENYKFDRSAEYNCSSEPAPGAPIIFEAKLNSHYNTNPANGCRYHFYGAETNITYYYYEHRININTPLSNYLDYKIYAAAGSVDLINAENECLEFNQNYSGIHEMQFYLDHLTSLIDTWLNSPNNTGNNKKWFASSLINSYDSGINA